VRVTRKPIALDAHDRTVDRDGDDCDHVEVLTERGRPGYPSRPQGLRRQA
jgi:hypothetical protein